MNWDQIQGKWQQWKGKVRESWGKLTDDDLDVINGRREQLAGRLQEVYGLGKEQVETQIRDFEARCTECSYDQADTAAAAPRPVGARR